MIIALLVQNMENTLLIIIGTLHLIKIMFGLQTNQVHSTSIQVVLMIIILGEIWDIFQKARVLQQERFPN